MLRPPANPLTPETARSARFWRDLDDRQRIPLSGGLGHATTLGQSHRPIPSRAPHHTNTHDPLTAHLKHSTSPITFTDTPVSLSVYTGLTGVWARANSRSYNFSAGRYIIESDSATPALTFSMPGTYRIRSDATFSYDASCAQPKILSDVTIRTRLKIGGTLNADTARYGNLNSKLCAAGLVYDVSLGTLTAETQMNPEISGYGDVTFEGDLGVSKVPAYSRWVGSRITVSGEYYITVIRLGNILKIQNGLRSGATAPAVLDPTIELFADRFDIEPAPTSTPPLTDNWLDAASTVIACHEAYLNIERLNTP